MRKQVAIGRPLLRLMSESAWRERLPWKVPRIDSARSTTDRVPVSGSSSFVCIIVTSPTIRLLVRFENYLYALRPEPGRGQE